MPAQVAPRGLLHRVKFGEHLLGADRGQPGHHRPDIHKEADSEAWLSRLVCRHIRNSRNTGTLRPVATGQIADGDQRLPCLGTTIDDSRRQVRPSLSSLLPESLGAAGQPIAKRVSSRWLSSSAIRSR